MAVKTLKDTIFVSEKMEQIYLGRYIKMTFHRNLKETFGEIFLRSLILIMFSITKSIVKFKIILQLRDDLEIRK